MAVKAEMFHSDGYVGLDLYPDHRRERVEDTPDVPDWDPNSPVWLYWDGKGLERGEREFVGVVVRDIGLLEEEHLAALERLDLPPVDCPEAGLYDATVVDVLRWAKRTYPGFPVTRQQVEAR